MTRFEASFYIVTCVIALAIHPLLDFSGLDGIFIWCALSITGFVAMLTLAIMARWVGFTLPGIAIVAIAYSAPFAGLVIFFVISTWGDFSLTPLIDMLPGLALWFVAPFGFPFAVALAAVVLGGRKAWQRDDKRLVALYAAVPICAILCYTCGPFVADSGEIAFIAPKLDAALQSGDGVSSVYSQDATVVVRPQHHPAVAAYVMAAGGFADLGPKAEMVARDLAGVGPKRVGDLLSDVRWPRDSGCVSNVRSMGGAYYVAVTCEGR